ncbi:MAG TPA: MlaD family protein [Solirubrobacteraceae bacterium]|nr:MlaD family protein [Solirubrobacteraceae bacterium]
MRRVPLARAAAAAAVVLAVVVVALVLAGDGDRHRYTLVFETAGQLVPDNDVQVAGRRVGRVRSIELTDDNLAAVEVEVEEPYAPLRDGTRAAIRLTSLSGIANRYVALTPGDGPALDDGARLDLSATTTVVDLDQLLNTLDARTRGDLRRVVRGFARQYAGKGREAAQAARWFGPLVSTSRRLAGTLAQDEEVLTRFLVDSSRLVTALADRRGELSDLVGNANAATRAIAAESGSLRRALTALPRTLRRATTTFGDLRATLDELDVLVAAARPATRDLQPLLRELRPVLASARPTIRDLRAIVTRPGPANDLLEATRRFPAQGRAAGPAFAASTGALRKLQPVVDFARPYAPELTGWFRDFGLGAANYDANGHFARVQPIFNQFRFEEDGAGGRLVPIPGSARFDGYRTGQLRRCPGAATPPLPDGSNPWRDVGGNLDCDPAHVPPGP